MLSWIFFFFLDGQTLCVAICCPLCNYTKACPESYNIVNCIYTKLKRSFAELQTLPDSAESWTTFPLFLLNVISKFLSDWCTKSPDFKMQIKAALHYDKASYGGRLLKSNLQMAQNQRFTYFSYSSSNSLPQQSAIPGHSFGHIRHQSPFCSTRRINRSGIQSPKKRSRARFSSLPWFFLQSKKSKISACHGSR